MSNQNNPNNQTNNRYECTQPELYAICSLGWSMIQPFQSQIESVFPEYTMGYIDGKLLDIAKAENMPDFQARDLASETAHILLKQKADPAIQNWRLLERYINRAFQSNPDLIKPNIEAAGKEFYESAARESPNWEDVKRLLVDGNNYITDNLTILTPVMPVAFPINFDTTKTDFDKQYNIFVNTKATSPFGTFKKLSANNAIYDDLMLMLADVKQITPYPFKDEITFTHLKGIISSPGPAGLKGTITTQDTGSKPAGVLLRLLDTDYEATTNGAGQYDFGNIASGKYNLQISLTGYQTQTIEITILTGVTSTKNYALTPNP